MIVFEKGLSYSPERREVNTGSIYNLTWKHKVDNRPSLLIVSMIWFVEMLDKSTIRRKSAYMHFFLKKKIKQQNKKLIDKTSIKLWAYTADLFFFALQSVFIRIQLL